jgi:hypothetical protein
MEDRFEFERLNDLIQEVQAFIRSEQVLHPEDELDAGNLLKRMYLRCNELAIHDR